MREADFVVLIMQKPASEKQLSEQAAQPASANGTASSTASASAAQPSAGPESKAAADPAAELQPSDASQTEAQADLTQPMEASDKLPEHDLAVKPQAEQMDIDPMPAAESPAAKPTLPKLPAVKKARFVHPLRLSSHAEPDLDHESVQAVVLPAAKASSGTTPATKAATAAAADVTASPSAAKPAAKVLLCLPHACKRLRCSAPGTDIWLQAQAAADDSPDVIPAKTKKLVPPKAAKKPKIALAASTPADAAQPPKPGGISAFSVFSQEYRTQLKSTLAAGCSIWTAATRVWLELITWWLCMCQSDLGMCCS